MTWWASTQHVMQYIQQNNISTIHQNTQLFNHFPFTSLDSFQVARLHGNIYHDKHIGKYMFYFFVKHVSYQRERNHRRYNFIEYMHQPLLVCATSSCAFLYQTDSLRTLKSRCQQMRELKELGWCHNMTHNTKGDATETWTAYNEYISVHAAPVCNHMH